MRKSVGVFVLLSMSLLNPGQSASSCCGETAQNQVRICSSLKDACAGAPGPAALVFFSLDCPVCWEELFEVRYIIEKNSIPIALVGISADPREDLEPFLAKHAFFHPVVCDRGRDLFRRFRVRLEPLTVVTEGERVLHRDNTVEAMDIRREKLKRCLLEITGKRPS